MIKTIKQNFKQVVLPMLFITCLGFLFAVGIRAVDYLWKKQPSPVFVCFYSDVGKVEVCEVFNRKDGKHD